MIGAKVVAHERSRTDGSTSTGDDLRGVDVSSFSTSAEDVGASKDSVGPVCRRALKIGPLDCSKLVAMVSNSLVSCTVAFCRPISEQKH